jgi:predicted dehydrogenase
VHLEALRAVPGVELAGICDPDKAAREWARAQGIDAYETAIDLIDGADLDAATIASPPAYHALHAIACLDSGIDVLCEKPLAVDGPSALRIMRVAQHAGRHLLLATKFRHVPDLIAARELIAAGAIGELVAFEIDFSSRVDMSGRWNAQRALSGGGVIIDNGCHAFDIVAFLFGTVTRVLATRLKPLQPIDVEDSATLLVAADGLIGRIDVSWSLVTERPTYVMVHGSKGRLEVGWRGSHVHVFGRPPEPIGSSSYDKHASHVAMMQAFLDVLRGTREPWITPAECLRTVAAVEASYGSLESGGWIPVDPMGVCEPMPERQVASA